ncbi:hypothetical protein CVCC1112_2158 [Paenarthrobacter nicotinovorans]|nr:hypothetical protein CVCC1112_2158 [Paenarthrobacter nicotinovorans]
MDDYANLFTIPGLRNRIFGVDILAKKTNTGSINGSLRR